MPGNGKDMTDLNPTWNSVCRVCVTLFCLGVVIHHIVQCIFCPG